MDRTVIESSDDNDSLHGLGHMLATAEGSSLGIPAQSQTGDQARSTMSSESTSGLQFPPDTSLPLPQRIARINSSSPHRAGSSESNISQNESERSGTSGVFEAPLRSLSAPGLPTSSLSVNTAQASMSSGIQPNGPRLFAALSGAATVTTTTRPTATSMQGASSSLPQYREVTETGRHIDDPSSSASFSETASLPSTSHRLTGLSVANGEPTSMSQFQRYTPSKDVRNIVRSKANDTSSMQAHLYKAGLQEGRHSDITVHAFGEKYKLHKIMLERAPFFASAFCGPWAESSAQEMTILPEDLDPNITKTGFELSLSRIYGTVSAEGEASEAIGLFATACWLNMPDLVDSCINDILWQMHPGNLHVVIKLATESYYGKPGDRILSSAKAMLCRSGWEMPYELWDNIPAEIIEEIIGGDPFYVPGEWERWYLTVKLLNRRLRRLAIANGLVNSESTLLCKIPSRLGGGAVRIPHARKSTSREESDSHRKWWSLYQHADVVPLLDLLDRGIHYVHLCFEQLQQMRAQKDIFGVPVLPDKIISDALWSCMELRQKVLSAHEEDLELGLCNEATADSGADSESDAGTPTLESAKGNSLDVSTDEDDMSSICSGKVTHNTVRRYWIPTTDVSCVLGGSHDAFPVSPLEATSRFLRGSQQPSASFEPADVTWPPDLGASISDAHVTMKRKKVLKDRRTFTKFPPYRFCAEFPNPRTLKEKKRVYSQTVWYAGNLWNLYIQRINTPGHQQLGIYLHRAKDKDNTDDLLALTVDDRIGQLEREMLMRKSERRHRHQSQIVGQWLSSNSMHESNVPLHEHINDESPTAGTSATQAGMPGPRRIAITTTAHIFSPQGQTTMTHFNNFTSSPPTTIIDPTAIINDGNDDITSNKSLRARLPVSPSSPSNLEDVSRQKSIPPSDEPLLYSSHDSTLHQIRKLATSTIPPYTDARSTIKTYFKIYSPSKGGRLLSMYESAPDSFIIGKSWGWKSSQIMLDEKVAGNHSAGTAGSSIRGAGAMDEGRDGKLRYMVVIGTV